jgi:uncharacterized protein YcbK (DUF882 family)
MQRRSVLTMAGMAGAAIAMPRIVSAALPRKRLYLYDAHSGAEIDEEYWVDGWYNPDALSRFNHFMKDRRSGEVRNMDPGLLDILHALQNMGSQREPIHLLCGYRSRTTNAMLARRSRGVARNSLHITGQASDIYMPGLNLSRLRDNAKSLQAGGVGYYPRSGFVHVDTGDIRYW